MTFRTRARAGLSLVLALAFVLAALAPATQSVSAAGSTHLNRYRVAPGDSFIVSGNGFSGGDEVLTSVDFRVNNNTQRVAAIAQADANGNFNAGIAVPAGTTQGTYIVTARDFHGRVAQQRIAVLPVAFLQVGTPHSIAVLGNREFYASGSGFGADEAVSLAATFPLYNGTSLQETRTAQTDKNGRFYEVLFPVPHGARNARASVTATGQTSGKKATTTLFVTYRPSIVLASTAVRPGAAVVIDGRDFVPDTLVSVSITFPRQGASTVTFTRSARTDGNGSFRTSIGMPGNASPGTYTVSASDQTGNFRASARVTVSIRPVATVDISTAFPGQGVTVKGSGFGFHVGVSVIGTFATSSGNRTVTANSTSGGDDTYSALIVIPGNASPGHVTLTARGPHGQATTFVDVQQRPAPKPTSTPVPTATSVPATAVPTTTVQLPPPPAQGKFHKSHGLQFTFISIWYHPIRVGSYEHIIIRAKPKTQLGIWVHLYFPSGKQYAYYENTDHSGQWTKVFQIPRSAVNSSANQTIVTFQLWKGKTTVKEFRRFGLVR